MAILIFFLYWYFVVGDDTVECKGVEFFFFIWVDEGNNNKCTQNGKNKNKKDSDYL